MKEMTLTSKNGDEAENTVGEPTELDTPNSGIVDDTEFFQHEIRQFRAFPYYQELRNDADVYFSHIKTGLAHSIMHREAWPGFNYWLSELESFLQSYSLRFTKVDHINLVKLLYSALTMDKLDYRVAKNVASVLTMLLERKKMLNRGDLTLEWRSLFKLYMEIQRSLVKDRVLLLLKIDVFAAIIKCNAFFELSATQEILNEIRPLICPWGDSTERACNILRFFLPTALTPADHDAHGAALWFEELWHWYQTNDNIMPSIGEKLLSIFARLARDCPGYIDWSDKLDKLFTQLLHSFKLRVGTDRVIFGTSSVILSPMAQLIAYAIGDKQNCVQEHLNQLFATCESYFYPSNCGAHTAHLLTFIHYLCNYVVHRVSRERYRPNRCHFQIPEHMHLSDPQIDAFVSALLPCLNYAAFSKTEQELVPEIMRFLAFLSPGIILPAVLDLFYPSLDALMEPHRLTQSLNILSCVCLPLVRDNAARSPNAERRALSSMEYDSPVSLQSYRRHALTILSCLLPCIDVNDIGKTNLAFQIIDLLLLLIPVVDCSEAVLVRSDLTDEEKELCSATAFFDSFIDSLFEKIKSSIEMLGHSVQISHTGEHQNLTKGKAESVEELVVVKGVLAVYKALISNCTTVIYEKICGKFFEYVRETVFNSKPAMDTITRMVMSTVAINPSYAFPIFFNFSSEKLHKLLTDEVLAEEEVGTEVIWYLTLTAEVIRGVPGTITLAYRQQIEPLLKRMTQCISTDAFKLAAIFSQNILYSLCSTYPIPKSRLAINDQSFEIYLPIRNWAKTVDRDNWTVEWHTPSNEEVDFASDLVDFLIFDILKGLVNADKMTDNEILKALTIVYSALEGCSSLCPYFDGEIYSLVPSATPNVQFQTSILPTNVKLLTAKDGGNLRRAIYEHIKNVAEFLLTKRENDTKSTLVLINILQVLMHVRGIDSATFQTQYSTFKLTKATVSDPLRNKNRVIEPIMEGIVAFMHAKRLLAKSMIGLTETHLDVLRLLLRLGISTYSSVRIEAQKALDTSFSSWIFSYKLLLDDILKYLKSYDPAKHYQFKGALYMLLNNKNSSSICVCQDWETLLKVWPTLVRAHFSENPSIIALFDTAHDVIVNYFSSFQVKYYFPDSAIPFAKKLIESYTGCVHHPVWANLTVTDFETAKQMEKERNKRNIEFYYKLCDELLKLATDIGLHWRHVEMAEAFLSLLFRRDVPLNDEVALFFFRLLGSDSVKTRKMAIKLTGYWLKANKPKSIKREHPFEVQPPPNNLPNGKWPIKYGYRKDNAMLLYDEGRQPRNAAEWNATRFFSKVYFGYYAWPTEFKSYAPINEQVNANRTKFTDLEKRIIALLNDETFFNKLIGYLSLEDKKSHDEICPVNFLFFYRLFRNFNTALFPVISKHLEKLLEDKQKSRQRLAAEIVGGFARGSKLWTFERVEPAHEWLRPRLTAAIGTLETDSVRNWSIAFVFIFAMCETRQVGWLIEMFFDLVTKPCDNTFHINARFHIISNALKQQNWHIPLLLRRLFELSMPFFGNLFQDLRFRAANCIATSIVAYLPSTYIDSDMKERLAFVTMNELMQRIEPEMNWLKNSTLRASDDPTASACASAAAADSVAAADASKRAKLVLITLIDLVYTLSAKPMNRIANIDRVFELVPILAHYSYETNDEELRDSCQLLLTRSLGTGMVNSADEAKLVVDTCVQTANRRVWWKATLGMLRFLQVFTFANLYAMRAHRDTVQRLCLELIDDAHLEVQMAAAETLSGLIHCAYLSVDHDLIEHIKGVLASNDPTKLHAAILTLSAIILAFPYTVPVFLPDVLMLIAKHIHGPQEIHSTVKKTLSEFRRTHNDCWSVHMREFTEDQLSVLTDLLVSPNYYV